MDGRGLFEVTRGNEAYKMEFVYLCVDVISIVEYVDPNDAPCSNDFRNVLPLFT